MIGMTALTVTHSHLHVGTYMTTTPSSNLTWRPSALWMTLPKTGDMTLWKSARAVEAIAIRRRFRMVKAGILCYMRFFLSCLNLDPTTHIRHCLYDYNIGAYPFANSVTYFKSHCDQCYRAVKLYNCKEFVQTCIVQKD